MKDTAVCITSKLVTFVAVVTALVFSSCDTNEQEMTLNPVGIWDLWSIEGEAPPVILDLWSIQSGSIDIRSNNTYELKLEGSFFDVDFSSSVSGVWRQTLRTIFLEQGNDDGCSNVAIIQSGGDNMKIDSDCENGWELVFTRR